MAVSEAAAEYPDGFQERVDRRQDQKGERRRVGKGVVENTLGLATTKSQQQSNRPSAGTEYEEKGREGESGVVGKISKADAMQVQLVKQRGCSA